MEPSLRPPLRLRLIAAGFSALLSLPASALRSHEAEAGSPLGAAARTEAELKHWVETRRLIGEERARWEEEKATLESLNRLRETEIAQLGEFIEAGGERVAELAARLEESTEEEETLKEWRRALDRRLLQLEEALRERAHRFPPPLQRQTQEAMGRLEERDPSRPLQQRARDALLVLEAVATFHHAITHDVELREIDGEAREVDVLYLGLSQAYYVDRSGNHAGRAVLDASGWQWHEDKALASRVRRALQVHQRETPPAFVDLPLGALP